MKASSCVFQTRTPTVIKAAQTNTKVTQDIPLLDHPANFQFEPAIAACQEETIGPTTQQTVTDQCASRICISEYILNQVANLVRSLQGQPVSFGFGTEFIERIAHLGCVLLHCIEPLSQLVKLALYFVVGTGCGYAPCHRQHGCDQDRNELF